MPKELRKRGKRAKKTREEDAYIVYAKPDEKAQLLAAVTGTEYTKKPTESEEPAYPKSRLDATPNYDQDEAYSNANSALLPPVAEESTSLWPAVDPDTKAYFKQLETQILEFEALHGDRLARKGEQAYENGGEEEEEEIDDRVLLLRAALTQLSGNEASIAADPETSPILERLVYSMDDFARRVLIDRFTGQYSDVAQDRFASHVLQALIVLGGGETVERERRGVIATGPFDMGEPSGSTATGQLPTMTECIVALTKEILKDLSALVKSQQGSYIVRALLLVLAGKPLPFDSQSSSTSGGRQSAMARSKKSARWKAGRGAGGEMRSFISDENNAQSGTVFGKGKAPERRIVPKIFEETLDELLLALDRTLSGSKAVNSEIAQQALRIASDDPIATGLVQIMLEIENDKGRSEKQGSMMDRLLQGLITAQLNDTLPHQPPRSDYIETLLRSNISSHVLEKLISLCPEPIFDLLFKVYFEGRMGRLAGHPVANFVCARVMERANQEQTEIAVEEIPPALEGIIENSRTGVLKALLEKTAEYKTGEEALNKALLDAFQTTAEDDIQYLVPCALSLMTLKLFKRNPSYTDPSVKAEMQLQGSLLLQSWLKLEKNSVTTSLLALPIPRLISLASDPTASRVMDAFLDEDNKAVAYKDRRAFLRNLIGHYQTLSDDRLGSRVAERCWAVADPFLKDKIAESLIPYEMKMQGSYFGHYFARKVNLPLYKRNKYDWKDRQARGVGGTPAELRAQQSAIPPQRQPRSSAQQIAPVAVAQAVSADATDSEKAGKKRRKARIEEADEIDQIFGGATKRGKLDAGVVA